MAVKYYRLDVRHQVTTERNIKMENAGTWDGTTRSGILTLFTDTWFVLHWEIQLFYRKRRTFDR